MEMPTAEMALLATVPVLLTATAGIALTRAVARRASHGVRVHGAPMAALTLTLLTGTTFGVGMVITFTTGTADPGAAMYLLGATGVIGSAWSLFDLYRNSARRTEKTRETDIGLSLGALIHTWALIAVAVGTVAGAAAAALATRAGAETGGHLLAAGGLGAIALGLGIALGTGDRLVRSIIDLTKGQRPLPEGRGLKEPHAERNRRDETVD